MKNFKTIYLGMLVCVLCTYLVARADTAGSLATSPHNLNNDGITLPQGQICVVCHTPHNAAQYADAAAPGELLWNHNTNPGATYTLYDGTNSLLDGTSRLCLSCHDGAIAVDAFGGNSGTTYMDTITDSNGVVGGGKLTVNGTTDLSNTHPIGVAYPGVTGKTGSQYSPGGFTFSGGTWNNSRFNNPNNFSSSGPRLVLMADGTTYGVGCDSCHTPHDYTNKFLRESNSGSQVCLTCHTK